MNRLYLPGGRIAFRPVNEDDAYNVTYWRNLPESRAAFFTKAIVTPDTHAAFLRNRKPHDLVWVIDAVRDGAGNPYSVQTAVGMTAVTVDIDTATGEYGRLVIGPEYQGQRYALEAEYLLLYAGFEWLRLDSLWLEAYSDNVPIIGLHNKTGWLTTGEQVRDGRGVTFMTYAREMWRERREDYRKAFGVELPTWR